MFKPFIAVNLELSARSVLILSSSNMEGRVSLRGMSVWKPSKMGSIAEALPLSVHLQGAHGGEYQRPVTRIIVLDPPQTCQPCGQIWSSRDLLMPVWVRGNTVTEGTASCRLAEVGFCNKRRGTMAKRMCLSRGSLCRSDGMDFSLKSSSE